jgi:hypothetical protein
LTEFNCKEKRDFGNSCKFPISGDSIGEVLYSKVRNIFEALCVFEGPAFINPRWAQKALEEPQNYSLPYIWTTTPKVTRGVSHCCLAIYIKKYLIAKKKNYGNSNISPCKNILFQKSSKRNQNPSRYYNSITNLKFQHKPKYHLSKSPHVKIDLLLRGQNPSIYYTSILNLNTISLPTKGKANK